MMKFLVLPILILLLSACASAKVSGSFGSGKPNISGELRIPISLSKNTDIYKTPHGVIRKGYTKEQVKRILGNPHRIRTHEDTEIWHYYFGKSKRLFVHFIDGKVIEVKDREGVGM